MYKECIFLVSHKLHALLSYNWFKDYIIILNNMNVNKALVVLEDGNKNVEISAKNIPDVKTARTNTINVYDILKYNTVIATKAVVAAIEEVYA